jgi:hypothetical protein
MTKLSKEVLPPRPGMLREIGYVLLSCTFTVSVVAATIVGSFKLAFYMTPVYAESPTLGLQASQDDLNIALRADPYTGDIESAGANNLTNAALYLTATGAQTNIALETNQGDNYFNTGSGEGTYIGFASGTAAKGKLNVNGDTVIQGRLIVNGVDMTPAREGGTYDTTAALTNNTAGVTR